jgi:hypothetical protein
MDAQSHAHNNSSDLHENKNNRVDIASVVINFNTIVHSKSVSVTNMINHNQVENTRDDNIDNDSNVLINGKFEKQTNNFLTNNCLFKSTSK